MDLIIWALVVYLIYSILEGLKQGNFFVSASLTVGIILFVSLYWGIKFISDDSEYGKELERNGILLAFLIGLFVSVTLYKFSLSESNFILALLKSLLGLVTSLFLVFLLIFIWAKFERVIFFPPGKTTLLGILISTLGVAFFFMAYSLDKFFGCLFVGEVRGCNKGITGSVEFLKTFDLKELLKISSTGFNKNENHRVGEKPTTDFAKSDNSGEEKETSGGQKTDWIIPKWCSPIFPNRYFVGFFVADYDYLTPLEYVKNDAATVKEIAECLFGVPAEHIYIYTDTTLNQMRKFLKDFVKTERGSNNLTLFYYSGHGITFGGNFYFLPKDAYIETPKDVEKSGLPLKEVENILKTAKGERVLFIDACRIRLTSKGYAVGGWGTKYLYSGIEVYDPNEAIVFSTATGKVANKAKNANLSAFAKALASLLEENKSNLQKLDLNGDLFIEVKELVEGLKERVEKYSQSETQKPTYKGNGYIPLIPLR